MPLGNTDGREPHRDLPAELADTLRPEIDSLAEEIVDDIRVALPEYARPLDGPYGTSIREGVHYALTLFVDQIADPDMAKDEPFNVHRKLGHIELREGRSLDTLQAAYRIGARVSWQRMMDVGKRAGLSAKVISILADAMMVFLDKLAAVALDGYLEARATSAVAVDSWRRRLLGMLLERPQAPGGAILELAELAGWAVPDEACAIAVHPDPDAGANDRPRLLDDDLLAELGTSAPHVLVPGPVTERRQHMLANALPGRHMSVGPCLPLEQAAESMRLARQTLALVNDGAVRDDELAWAEQHYLELLLRSDDALLDRMCHHWFARLESLTPKQHARMIETLKAWIDEQGSIPHMAERMEVHAQSVRYRLKLLADYYGDALYDPRARFEMQLIFHAGPRGHARSR